MYPEKVEWLNNRELYVDNYYCRHLGGVAGNAGIFSNIKDLTKYIQMLQNKGKPIFSEKVFNMGIKNYTKGKGESICY